MNVPVHTKGVACLITVMLATMCCSTRSAKAGEAADRVLVYAADGPSGAALEAVLAEALTETTAKPWGLVVPLRSLLVPFRERGESPKLKDIFEAYFSNTQIDYLTAFPAGNTDLELRHRGYDTRDGRLSHHGEATSTNRCSRSFAHWQSTGEPALLTRCIRKTVEGIEGPEAQTTKTSGFGGRFVAGLDLNVGLYSNDDGLGRQFDQVRDIGPTFTISKRSEDDRTYWATALYLRELGQPPYRFGADFKWGWLTAPGAVRAAATLGAGLYGRQHRFRDRSEACYVDWEPEIGDSCHGEEPLPVRMGPPPLRSKWRFGVSVSGGLDVYVMEYIVLRASMELAMTEFPSPEALFSAGGNFSAGFVVPFESSKN